MIKLTPAAARILAMIERAAELGEPCPENGHMAEAIGADSTSTPVKIMGRLQDSGKIAIERGSNVRVVTILSTGKKTAGTITKPHWSEDKARRASTIAHMKAPPPRTGAMRLERKDKAMAGVRVDRDPCPRCGVRGDYGCRHQSATAALEGAA